MRDRLVGVRNDLAETGQIPIMSEILEPLLPTPVFEANVDSLGEIEDTDLATDIATLYVRIEFIKRLVRVLLERIDKSEREGDNGEDITAGSRAGYFEMLSGVLVQAGKVEHRLLELLKGSLSDIEEAEDERLSIEISNLLERIIPF